VWGRCGKEMGLCRTGEEADNRHGNGHGIGENLLLLTVLCPDSNSMLASSTRTMQTLVTSG